MIKPVFWMGVGAYAALRGRKKAIEVTERYVPKAVAERVTTSVKGSAKGLADDVARVRRDAREAMKAKEEELRTEIAGDVASSAEDAAPKPTV